MVVSATIAPKKQAKEMENLLANLKQVVCNDTSLRYYQFENKQKIYKCIKILISALSCKNRILQEYKSKCMGKTVHFIFL